MTDERDTELETTAIEEETPTSVKIVAGRKYIATLVNGENFFYGTLRFKNGVPVVVTAEQAQHLSTKVIKQSLLAPDETAQPLNRKRFHIKVAPATAVVTKPAPVRHRHRVSE